jgi:hypothetical protein
VAVTFIAWLWGKKYDGMDVAKLGAGIRRHYHRNYHFVVFSDRAVSLPDGIEVRLISNPELMGQGCFCRLRMFDPDWQAANGFDDRIVSLDLDAVIVGMMEPLFDRSEPFLILQNVNAMNPNPFNCSVMMLRAGAHPEVWSDFSMEKAAAVPFHKFPDDQGWLWHKLPAAAGWDAGHQSGIYGFQKPGWPRYTGQELPRDARIVCFIGWRKPQLFGKLPWMKVHWRV